MTYRRLQICVSGIFYCINFNIIMVYLAKASIQEEYFVAPGLSVHGLLPYLATSDKRRTFIEHRPYYTYGWGSLLAGLYWDMLMIAKNCCICSRT